MAVIRPYCPDSNLNSWSSAGVVRLGMSSRPHLLHELQAAAAAGQSVLVQSYENAFKQHGLISAQVLLSHDDVTARDR